jgi:Leucine-rich repeat (LRR) protein
VFNHDFRLNDIVSNNVSTLKKLKLMLKPDKMKDIQKAKEELTRPYANVYIRGSDETYNNESYMKFSKNTAKWLTSHFCSRLRDLRISSVRFQIPELKLFKKSLQSLHQLENLSLYNCDIDDYENSMQSSVTAEPVHLESLKNLYVSSSHLVVSLISLFSLIAIKIVSSSSPC